MYLMKSSKAISVHKLFANLPLSGIQVCANLRTCLPVGKLRSLKIGKIKRTWARHLDFGL